MPILETTSVDATDAEPTKSNSSVEQGSSDTDRQIIVPVKSPSRATDIKFLQQSIRRCGSIGLVNVAVRINDDSTIEGVTIEEPYDVGSVGDCIRTKLLVELRSKSFPSVRGKVVPISVSFRKN